MIETLKLSLEAITKYLSECPDPSEEAVEGLCDAASAARAAIAKAETQGEPVAWHYFCGSSDKNPVLTHTKKDWADSGSGLWREVPLYTTPQPKREWVGLTDEEIQYCVNLQNPEAIAEEIEAKLKE